MKNKTPTALCERSSLLSLLLYCFVALAFTLSPLVHAGELKIGKATTKITPPMGTPMAGYYFERGADGVLDDLFAKAMVIDDGQTKVALVVCDLISLPRYIVLRARELIQQQTGIPGDNVMISATHSHTGPVISGESALDELDGGQRTPTVQYAADLPKRIAEAVVQAASHLVPAKASYARESEPRLAFNRRHWMRDGTVGWNPGKLNPNRIRPVGPIDPEVDVVYFETADQKPLVTYVNYAMHPETTGGSRISADYPGALSRRVADYKGPEMLTIFANGTCGNLNHVNVEWAAPQQGTNEANRLGTILAGNVFKAYMDLQPVADTTLRVARQVLELPLPPVTDDDVREAKEVVKRGAQAKFMEQVKAYQALDVKNRNGKPQEVEVQVIALGKDLAWVSLPGEIFVELGLSIKAASPFKQTQLAELANGSIGYIPNRSAYAEGNYEVVSARCAEGSGEMLVTAALKLLNELATK